MNMNSLPADVVEAIQQGETIEAIKRLRLATGLGLKEAKDIVDACSEGEAVVIASAKPSDTLPAEVVAAIQRGNKIEAIKLLRELTGLGLKEAKDAVDASPHATSSGSRPAIEIPGTGNALLWFVAVVLAVLAAYYLYSQSGA